MKAQTFALLTVLALTVQAVTCEAAGMLLPALAQGQRAASAGAYGANGPRVVSAGAFVRLPGTAPRSVELLVRPKLPLSAGPQPEPPRAIFSPYPTTKRWVMAGPQPEPPRAINPTGVFRGNAQMFSAPRGQ